MCAFIGRPSDEPLALKVLVRLFVEHVSCHERKSIYNPHQPFCLHAEQSIRIRDMSILDIQHTVCVLVLLLVAGNKLILVLQSVSGGMVCFHKQCI